MAAEIVLSSASKSLPMLYNSLVKKEKERFETIVEPFQCVLQLAFLAFCEKNTKITIQKNIVHLQYPTSYQGIVRWYQNDSKEDLYFLFNAIRRFSHFYKHLKTIKNEKIHKHNLYDMLIHYAVIGLQRLIDTYTSQSKPSLLYTLQMYKILLETPDNFKMDSLESEIQKNIDGVFNKITDIYDDNLYYLAHSFIITLLKTKNVITNQANISYFNTIIISNIENIHTWISKNVVY
jgi:hypothetical protein